MPATGLDERPVAAAFAASAVVHALLVLVMALLIGSGGIGRSSAPQTAALRATLAAASQKFAKTEPVVQPPQPAAAEAAAPAAPLPKAFVPLPVPAAPPPEVRASGEGRLMVQVVEADETPDVAALAGLHSLHPRAARVVPEFEVEPIGVYPEVALADRRQLMVTILAVVHEDGRLELAPGSFEDPLFGASVRAALASAMARAPQAEGKAVTGWTLLRFYYEFVGAGLPSESTEPQPAR